MVEFTSKQPLRCATETALKIKRRFRPLSTMKPSRLQTSLDPSTIRSLRPNLSHLYLSLCLSPPHQCLSLCSSLPPKHPFHSKCSNECYSQPKRRFYGSVRLDRDAYKSRRLTYPGRRSHSLWFNSTLFAARYLACAFLWLITRF